MDDSDDEFKELCAKLLRRVKRNVDEGNNNASRRGLSNVKTSTAAKTSLKKPKPVAKSKRKDETAGKKGGLCAKPKVESNQLPFAPKALGEQEQTACASNVPGHEEEAPKVPVSASQRRNEHPRPQPGDYGNTCFQVAPCAENPEVTFKDTQESDTQPCAGIQTTCAEGLQPHPERQATPILGVMLQTDSELVSSKSAQPRMDNKSAENLRTPFNAVSAREESAPPCFATQMTPADCAQHHIALKTVQAKVACPKVVDQALEKMQQFKRADPRRMKHSAEESTASTSDTIVLLQDQLENVKDPTVSVTENDQDFALALQQDIPIQNKVTSLEEEGLYFCQLCQKNLSAMNSALRQQHMNRCLDEGETSVSPVSVSPRIPECPICGKQFNTAKSRATHLKRCATTMQVSPQMLLQAVQMQALNAEVSLPVVSSSKAGGVKRKGSTKESVPSKKQKHSVESTKAEDMLVALVMSRSLLDQERQDGGSVVTSGKMEVAQLVRMRPGAEKKSRKKKKDAPPPTLLIQDPETAIKQIQNRVAALLSEEMELSCTPVLPVSRFWDKSQDIDWRRSSSKGSGAVLWRYSAMMDTPPSEFFYTKELVPPISVWINSQNQKPAIFPAEACNEKQPIVLAQPSSVGVNTENSDPARPRLSSQLVSSSCSQMDKEAFQDLMDLAGEGITLTQWKLGADPNPSIDTSGKNSVVSDITQSGFVPPPKDYINERRSCRHSPLVLNTLAADFGGMVNNPHLSDVQFQMDCGEVLYAHMFVLYARCPLLVELVHSEGFLVEEDGDARTRRVLLNDISANAACSFLRYLYSASTDLPYCCLSDVAALSVRFGVSELLKICESNNFGAPVSDEIASEDELYSEEKEERNGSNRADNFQELLKSMWMDEDEEVVAELEAEGLEDNESLVEDEKVNEDELEEIYEFASTQRKVGVYNSEEDAEVGLDSETENTQNLHQKTGYVVEHVEPSERKGGELQEYNFVAQVPSVALYSSNKKPRFLIVSKDTSVAMEGVLPTQCNQPKCSSVTESHVPESQEKRILGNVAEHAVDELDSPILLQDVREDNDDVLLQETLSQHSHQDLNDSYDRMFLDTFDEYLEPSQADHKPNHLRSKVVEKCGAVSHFSLLSNVLQESLPSETSQCKSPIVNQSSSRLPVLGLSPPYSNIDRTPLVKGNPQRQSSSDKAFKPSRSTSVPLQLSPQTHCLNLQTPKHSGSRTRPAKTSPQNLASPFSSPDKEKTQFLQSSPQSPCLLFPSPETDRSNVSTESQRSPFSYRELMRKKSNGALFSAEAVSKLKKVVQGIALNYSNRMKQDTDSPTNSNDSSKQSTAVQTQCSFVEKDNIIILDSDEDTELDQQIKKSPTYSPFSMKEDLVISVSTIGKVKSSQNSPQLLMPKKTSVFYVDQNETVSVPASEACKDGNITPEMEFSSNLKLHLSCDEDQSHEETSSSMETSWLVPATPLLSQSRQCSSHIQMASFQNVSKLKQLTRPDFETSVDDSHSLVNVSIIKPTKTPNLSVRASQLTDISEKNSNDPLTAASLAVKITAQDLGNKDNLDGSTIKQSPAKSLTIPCIPLLASSNSFSGPAYMQSESPLLSTKVISVDLSPQEKSTNSSVFEMEDGLVGHSEHHLPSSGSLQMDFELPVPVEECWNIECLTPAEKDKSELEEHDTQNLTRVSSRESDTESVLWKSQAKRLTLTGIKRDTKSPCQHNCELPEHESSPQMPHSLQNSKLSFLNTSEWDDWNGEEHNLPVAIPLSQSIPTQSASIKHKTPVAAFHKRNQVPAVPITPLPSYSDMDTPKLKKELDRFGVRALPKRKMVLKLKEIFQYTHQTMSSDSDEEIPTSQLQARAGSVCLSQPMAGVSAQRQGRCSAAAPRKRKTAISSQPPSDSSSERPKKTSNKSFKKPAKSQKSSSTAAKKNWTATLSPTKSPGKSALHTMTASQESTASSAAGSDISFNSQSSSTNEFETAFASGEEEDDESITLSQVGVQEKDKAEAVRRYLHLNPDLYNKILLYEPIELAGLQAELKQNGIKMSMGKLLDFLDAHCITFTTAAARKEKLERKQKKQGKKKMTAKRF